MEKNSPSLVAGSEVVRLADDIAEQEGTSCERENGEDVIIHEVASLIFVLDAAESDSCTPHSWVAFLEDALEELFESCF